MEEALKNIDLDNPEFDLLWKVLHETNSPIFLTGKAGTGKSTFLKYVCSKITKKFVVLAPTGIAAVNVKGQTLHSFFKLPFRPILPNDPEFQMKGGKIYDALKYSKEKIKLIQKAELIIIDEISMVRVDIIDALDQILRAYSNRHLPFGGKQLLFVGDLFQLEPVVKSDQKRILNQFYRSPYFFDARAFREMNLITIELKKVYRQEENEFVEILDQIRGGYQLPSAIQSINNRVVNLDHFIEEDYVIQLSSRRDSVDFTNQRRLGLLESKEHTFIGKVEGEFNQNNLPTDLELKLKEGAQIIFIKNDMEKRWYNGTIGRIKEIRGNSIMVELEDGMIVELEEEKWSNVRYKYDDELDQIKEEEVGSFVQFPIKLAWAITIHKSQGLTFDKVYIDLKGGAFAAGQTYVALSRCRTIDGMQLKYPISARDVIINESVVQFMSVTNSKKMIDSARLKDQSRKELLEAYRLFTEGCLTNAISIFMSVILKQPDLFDEKVQRLIRIAMAKHQNHISEEAEFTQKLLDRVKTYVKD